VDAAHAKVRAADGIDNAWYLARCLEIDRAQPRVGVFAAHERDVQLARKLQVLDEASLPPQQTWVFQAPYGSADERHQATP
jgi:hypothetical protein